jgi:hypothetical protein
VIDGTHARACAALESRLRWVSEAPFGVPVVPLVYWMSARSSVVGFGWDAGSGPEPTTDSHGTVPVTRSCNAVRASRARAIGRVSARRVRSGIAFVMSTEMSDVTARSAGNSWTDPTTLVHTIACLAPWSSNCLRSSRGV